MCVSDTKVSTLKLFTLILPQILQNYFDCAQCSLSLCVWSAQARLGDYVRQTVKTQITGNSHLAGMNSGKPPANSVKDCILFPKVVITV